MKSVLDNYLVEKYPKIFENTRTHPTTNISIFGFENDDGWFWLLNQLCESIQHHIDGMNKYAINGKQQPQVVATYIKEKYGMLSFNYTGGDDIIDGMVMLTENLSYKTCEICGTTKNVGSTSGGITICCGECHKNDERISKLEWQEHEDIDKKLERKIKLNNLK